MSMEVSFYVQYIGSDAEYNKLEEDVRKLNNPPIHDETGAMLLYDETVLPNVTAGNCIFEAKHLFPVHNWMERQQLWEDDEKDHIVIIPNPVMEDFLLVTSSVLDLLRSELERHGCIRFTRALGSYCNVNSLADALFDNPAKAKEFIAEKIAEECNKFLPANYGCVHDWQTLASIHKLVYKIIKAIHGRPKGKIPFFTYQYSL